MIDSINDAEGFSMKLSWFSMTRIVIMPRAIAILYK